MFLGSGIIVVKGTEASLLEIAFNDQLSLSADTFPGNCASSLRRYVILLLIYVRMVE